MTRPKKVTEKQLAAWARLRESGHFARVGKIGGDRNKAIQLERDPEWFNKLGDKGGNTLLAKRGPKYYAKIGKLPRRKTASL